MHYVPLLHSWLLLLSRVLLLAFCGVHVHVAPAPRVVGVFVFCTPVEVSIHGVSKSQGPMVIVQLPQIPVLVRRVVLGPAR